MGELLSRRRGARFCLLLLVGCGAGLPLACAKSEAGDAGGDTTGAGGNAGVGDRDVPGDPANGDAGGCLVGDEGPGDGGLGDPSPGDGSAGDSVGGDASGGDANGGDGSAGDSAGGDASGGDALAGGDPPANGDSTGPPGDPIANGDDAGHSGDPATPGDEGPPGDASSRPCPAEMVPVNDFCVDRYEASRLDATASDAGSDDSIASSRAGVMPWWVNPMTPTDVDVFRAACVAADKRLCTNEEWLAACEGPGEPPTLYAFGDVFDRETCNCVDTLCDDYCVDNSIDPADCNTATNCGYHCGTIDPPTNVWCHAGAPTGSFPACTNAYGHFDLNGNLWEIVEVVDDPTAFEIRGGAFNCAAPATRLQCSFVAGWTALYAGFRCCLDR